MCSAVQNPWKRTMWKNLYNFLIMGFFIDNTTSSLALWQEYTWELTLTIKVIPRETVESLLRGRTQHFLFPPKNLGSPGFQDRVCLGMSLYSLFLLQTEGIMHTQVDSLTDTKQTTRPRWLPFHPRFYRQSTLCLQMKCLWQMKFCIWPTEFNRIFVWLKFSVVL